MPQIRVNEIDQSIYTRVVTDDKVRVMIPGIASFGPGATADLTDLSGVTFTDANDFDKVFGYTAPEYNPFKSDVSRMYAKQLINRGAAVTFVKINNGLMAKYDIGDVTVSQVTTRGIAEAASYVGKGFTLTTEQPADWTTNYAKYFTKSGTTYLKVTGDSAPTWATNTYYANDDSNYDADIHMFAEQIDSVTAKYAGSFGNRLLVTFTPVTSANRSYTYQYSMVTVYRADIVVDTKTDGDTIDVTPRITGVHKLESHIVSTNPKDVNYFVDVDFDYITIKPTATAYDELSIIWSDMAADPEQGAKVYSGFPEIPLKYTDATGNTKYNAAALLTEGMDFDFGADLNAVLKRGFGGFNIDGTNSKVTTQNINKWIWACYKEDGVIESVLNGVRNCYENYTDPYVYDFDFITSGGFLDETFVLTGAEDPETHKPVEIDDTNIATYTGSNPPCVITVTSDRNDENIPDGVRPIHRAMLNLVNTRQDCIALFDINPFWDKDSLPLYVNSVNTSFGAFHAPWCYCNNPDALGTVLMPPSFVFLYTMLSNLINNTEAQKWFPPAGVTRATARVVVRPLYEIGSVLLDKWENNTLARVNPIMKLKNYGYVIYGQYTAYVAQDENTHSALESLNVRLISNCVKKQIFNTCLKLTFEPNNSSLWMKFYDAMDKYLLFMKRNDGVYDYRIQMDEGTVTTDDINELRCPGKVWINPVRTAEFFDIDFILTEAGVTFTDTVEEGV